MGRISKFVDIRTQCFSFNLALTFYKVLYIYIFGMKIKYIIDPSWLYFLEEFEINMPLC